MTAQPQTPVTILGGYLGAGKTTLVNHLLRNANGKRLAILVNEFGELPIDADLIEAQDDDIISLSGGCVCCSYGNDLVMAMVDMARMEPRPDHIILEASGVALPGAISASLSLLDDYTVDGVIVLADAETVRERAADKYMSDTVLRQLDEADIVLLNKADIVTPDELTQTKDWLVQVSGDVPIVEASHAQVPPAIVLQDFERIDEAHEGQPSHAATHFQTQFIAVDEPVDPAEFASQLIEGEPNLVRAKGFLKTAGGMQTLQIVGRRAQFTQAPPDVKPGIVTITVRRPD